MNKKEIATIFDVPISSIGKKYSHSFRGSNYALCGLEKSIIKAYFREVDAKTAEIKKEFREHIHRVLFGDPKVKAPKGILKNK